MPKTKKVQAPHETVARYRDGNGNLWDVITHSECNGYGCERCGGFGFVKQAVIELGASA